MGLVELIFTSIALSMDAFAVSMCKGLAMPKLNLRQGAVVALYFGGFQGIMPLIGYLLGSRFQRFIVPVDHWVAFVLLAFIGGKMLIEAIREEEGCDCCCEQELTLNHKELLVMAVATSVDALAVGITLAFLQVDILLSVTLIGVITFLMCMAGVAIGNFFGSRYKRKAEILGGAVLVLIGLKILLEHLGVIGF